MSRIQLTMAGGRYDRTRALLDRSVQPEGIDLEYLEMPIEEVFWRLLRYGEFDLAECSLAYYMIATSQGQRDYIALPIFPSRCFRHGFVFINRDAGIRTPSDLRGKTIGVPEYAMTAALWLRGLFQHDYGVAPSQMHWRTGGIEEPNRADRMEVRVNADVDIAPIPAGKCLNDMLVSGEIDVLVSPRIPSAYRAGRPQVVRLFPDYKQDELKLFGRCGFIPIMHTVVMRRSVYDKNPWMAQSLLKAFRESTRRCLDMMLDVNALPYSLPWYLPALEETVALLGPNFWEEGLERNWAAVQALMGYATEQGLIGQPFTPEQLFAPNTLQDFRI